MKFSGGSTRQRWTWTALVVGAGLATSGWATSLVVPDAPIYAPGGAIPLLSTQGGWNARSHPSPPREAGARGALSWQVPLAFEPADSLAPSDAGFAARGPGYSVFLGAGGAILALQGKDSVAPAGRKEPKALRHGSDPASVGSRKRFQVVRMRLEGARADAPVRLEAEQAGKVHRLQGSDPSRWRTGLRTYGRVVYSEVYPGMDVAYYGSGRELEYDFIVAPGADSAAARLRFDGVTSMQVDGRGDLLLQTDAGVLTQRRPVAFQQGPEGREPVEASYVLHPEGSVGFQIGEYDHERPLVIDPVLSYATFLGGTGLDQCWDIAVDEAGYAYVAGETESVRLSGLRILSKQSFQTNYQGGLTSVAGDAFVAKLNPNGTAVEWFTYLGGNDLDAAFTLALGSGGEPVVAGFTTSTNFPVTPGVLSRILGGETNRYTGRKPLDGFVTRLKADGSGLVASTLFGAEGEDQVLDLVLTAGQSVALVGSTTSSNLPLPAVAGSALAGSRDGFFAVLAPNLASVVSGRYLGGSGRDSFEGIALSPDGAIAHVAGITESTNFPVRAAVQTALGGGFDAVAAGFRMSDAAVEYATYLGGTVDDYGYRISTGPNGKVWVAGVTFSTNFPVVAPIIAGTNTGFADALLARFAPDGQTLEMSTYFGGTFDDSFWDVQVDTQGHVHLVGETLSTSLPGVNTNALLSTNLGLSDILIVRIAADGVLTTTLFGAPGDELGYAVAPDAAGNAYIAGRVRSVAFPVSSTNVAQTVFGGDRTDGFVMKVAYEPTLTAQPASDGIVLSWPAPNREFALESAPTAGFSGVWSRELAPVVTAEGRHSVRLPMTATNCVFRLRWDR